MNSPQSRIFGLDLMRAVAICMVVIGHVAWLFPDFPQTLALLLSLSAFFGVEVFFVLSGFLIGRILLREFEAEDFSRKSVLHFLKRRWFRTLPAYFLILLINIGLAISYRQELGEVWRYFIFMQNFAWTMPSFFPESWSLSVEEFAYVLLPMALLFVGSGVKKRSEVFIKVAIGLVLISWIAKLIYHFTSPSHSMEEWNLSLKAVVIYRVDAIFLGVLFAWFSVRYADLWRKSRWLLAIVGVLGIVFFTGGVGALGLFIETAPMFWDVLYLPMVSLSFALFLPILSSWKSTFGFSRIPVSFTARISYSMYLIHYSILLQAIVHSLPQNAPMRMRLAAALFYFFTLIVLSWILYRFYEKPMMDLRDKTSRNP